MSNNNLTDKNILDNNELNLSNDERTIGVSYNSMQELVDRQEYIRETLKSTLKESDTPFEILREFVSFNNDKYISNYIIKPIYN